ncbi:putative methyltransferase NSUN7 [Branchiostoma lanceolatum]|uniref:putative methyltransferase NSUN7 n=1 Tax=Branchiostoma lanceolatum TaxID=7740 RepID=UPI003455C117
MDFASGKLQRNFNVTDNILRRHSPTELRAHSLPNVSPSAKQSTEYSHQVYVHASEVFESLLPKVDRDKEVIRYARRGDGEVPRIHFRDEGSKRQTYNLAFTTLKYQHLIETVLIESGFFIQHPVSDEDQSLVTVILCDLMNRNFRLPPPVPNSTAIPIVTEVQETLMKARTKLNGALARNRIKHQALSLDVLLPEKVREKDKCSSTMPIYVWVNILKQSVRSVISYLLEQQYEQVRDVEKLEGKTFYLDPLCADVLVFPASTKEMWRGHPLLEEGYLVLQDRTCSLACHAVRTIMETEGDVLHTHVGTGRTAAHGATFLDQEKSNLFACGVDSPQHVQEVESFVGRLGIKNVRLLQDDFLELDPADPKFKNVRVILVTPRCSRSGVNNAVDFLMNEGEDATLLRDLSKEALQTERVYELAGHHCRLLQQAFKFPKLEAIVYLTRSIYEEENEDVILKTLEYANSLPDNKRIRFKSYHPMMSKKESDTQRDKFLRVQPSENANGCFLAVLAREPEAAEKPQDVIARAAATGIIDEVTAIDPVTGELIVHGGRKKRDAALARRGNKPIFPHHKSNNKHNGIPLTNLVKMRMTEKRNVLPPHAQAKPASSSRSASVLEGNPVALHPRKSPPKNKEDKEKN